MTGGFKRYVLLWSVASTVYGRSGCHTLSLEVHDNVHLGASAKRMRLVDLALVALSACVALAVMSCSQTAHVQQPAFQLTLHLVFAAESTAHNSRTHLQADTAIRVCADPYA